MVDISQTNLSEPERVEWDSAFSGSKYSAPPPATGPDGKPITYFGQVIECKTVNADVDRETEKAYLQYQVDFKLVRSGSADGQQVRTWISTRPFTRVNALTGEREPMKGNPNRLASFLRSAGLAAKPQSNGEYSAAVKMVSGKAVPFTIDWKARNKDTGEQIRGYLSFPEDSERPGTRKSILKKGDLVTLRDAKGAVTGEKIVESEVLFANAEVKYFQDPQPVVR